MSIRFTKPAPRRHSLLERVRLWLHPKPTYKMAPPLGPRAGYLGLHIGHTSSSRSALK